MASLRSDKSSVGAFSSSEDLLAQLDPPERKIRQKWLAARARARRSPRSIRVDTKLARENSGKIPEEDTRVAARRGRALGARRARCTPGARRTAAAGGTPRRASGLVPESAEKPRPRVRRPTQFDLSPTLSPQSDPTFQRSERARQKRHASSDEPRRAWRPRAASREHLAPSKAPDAAAAAAAAAEALVRAAPALAAKPPYRSPKGVEEESDEGNAAIKQSKSANDARHPPPPRRGDRRGRAASMDAGRPPVEGAPPRPPAAAESLWDWFQCCRGGSGER